MFKRYLKGTKRGRPIVKDEFKKSNIYTKSINLRVTAEQKSAIEQIARLHDRSIVGYLRQLINEAMARHEVKS